MAISSGKKIEIVIELDNKGAVRSVKELENAIKGINQPIKETESSFSTLGATIAGIATGAALGFLVKEIGSLAQEGAKIDGLSRSFQELQASVGSSGTESLNKLRVATSGLINDFELMRLSNQAVLLGLPTEGFDKMAEAATKLGIATGRTANEALQDLITGVGRASPLILDNLGILVDTQAAYENYAQSIGVATEKLTEQQKTLAFQAEAYDRINEKSRELSEVNLGAGASVTQLSVAYDNVRASIATAINDNATLGAGVQLLTEAFTNLSPEIIDAANALATVLGGAFIAAGVAAETFNVIIDNLLALMIDTKKVANDFVVSFQVMNKLVDQAGNLEMPSLSKATQEVVDEFIKAGKASGTLNDAMRATVAGTDKQVTTTEKLSTSINRKTIATVKDTKAEDDAKKKAEDLAKAWERLNDQVSDLTGTTGLEKYETQLRDLFEAQSKGAISSDELKTKILEIGEAFRGSEKDLGVYTDKVKDAQRATQDYAKDQERIKEQLKDGIQTSLGNGLADALDALTTGGSLDSALTGLGSSMGATLGTAIGGPIGGALGQTLGSLFGKSIAGIGENTKKSIGGLGTIFAPMFGGSFAGDLVGGLFGGKSEERKVRDAFVDSIKRVLDEKPLQLIIDDQLQKLSFTSAQTGSNDLFAGLGESLAGALGVVGGSGSQLDNILSSNIGNLNNLQILINQLGISAEQMQEQVKSAWLAGDTSANEALVTLQKINQVTTQGIPDGLGMLSTAFNNLSASGGAGNLVLDALGDIAVEAKEKGIDTLTGAMQDLIASGADSAKVTAAFEAIKNAGIGSIDALKNISVDAAIQIAAALENTPDFFAEKIAKLEDIKNKLREIESKEVDIKFNFKSTVDQNTQNAISAGAFTSAGIPNIGSEGI